MNQLISGGSESEKYFFILGNNPALSLAELSAVFHNQGDLFLVQKNVAIFKTNQEISSEIIKKIGGTIKFGRILGMIENHKKAEVLKTFVSLLTPSEATGKFRFGISDYGKNNLNLKALAMEYKKSLKQSGFNSRWVTSREPTLSSVVVEQNKLVGDKGIEAVIIKNNNKLLLGKTLAVQPFKELSRRDYGRPARDDFSGMLPPKLAQIMINLAAAGPEQTLLDPFCGSGTIITEAMLMGFLNIFGSDITDKAIEDTKKNIEWIKHNYQLPLINCELMKYDATRIAERLKPESIDAIVTEPYLGPQRGRLDAEKIVKELESLYAKTLSEFKKILKSGGKAVMVWPRFHEKRQTFCLKPELSGLEIICPLTDNLRPGLAPWLTERQTLVYGREGQRVWREIVVLKK